MREKIYIYHTNDVHSHFENWPRISSFLAGKRELHESESDQVYIFDIGDFADRWHPMTEATMGKGNVRLLNEAAYTAVTIGNNEGITLPHTALDSLYDDAHFDVICANLHMDGGQRPHWVLPYKIYETAGGTRVGVTAATAYFRKMYSILGWQLTEPITELQMQVNELKEKTDVLIVLSHLGIYDDEKLAEAFPEIDLILGGHTHHVLPEGKLSGHSLLAAGGKHGMYIGEVELEIDLETRELLHKKAVLHPVTELPSVPEEEQFAKELYNKGKELLQRPVASLPAPLSYDWYHKSELPRLLCSALQEWCGGDCAFINAGLVLADLPAGTATEYDIHRMLPHPINPCLISLTGAELKEVLIGTADETLPALELKGLGFRGSVMGAFVYSGIRFDREQHAVYINEEMLDPDRKYEVATTDMFAFGRFFPAIRRAEQKRFFMPEFLRDIMAWKLKALFGEAQGE